MYIRCFVALVLLLQIANAQQCQNITQPQPVRLPDLGVHSTVTVETWWIFGVANDTSGRQFGIDFFLIREAGECNTDLSDSIWTLVGGVTDPISDWLWRGTFSVPASSVSATKLNEYPFKIEAPQTLFKQTLLPNIWQIEFSYSDYIISLPVSFRFTLIMDPSRTMLVGPTDSGYDCWVNTVPEFSTCSMQVDNSLIFGTGSLTLDGETFDVSGKFFHSHQWTYALPPTIAGITPWIWLTFQLSNGWTGEVSLQLDPLLGQGVVTLIKPTPRGLKQINFNQREVPYSVVPTQFWTSPWTNNTYGTHHTFTLPSENLQLFFSALINDGDYLNLYEAPSSIIGTIDGVSVTGTGTTEYSAA